MSVLFCDVVGFTAASEGADPEDVRARMRAYYGGLRPVIGSHGGTVLIEAGEGRRAAWLQANLAECSWFVEGPAVAVVQYEHATAFAAERGLVDAAQASAAACMPALVATGRLTEAVELAGTLLPLVRQSGNRNTEIELLTRQALVLSEQGADASGPAQQALGLTEGFEENPEYTAMVAWIAGVASGDSDAAHARLDELARSRPRTFEYALDLPTFVRAAAAVGDADLVERLAEIPDTYPAEQHALVTTGAIRAEQSGDYARSAVLYAEAAKCWDQFKSAHEQAYAVLGQGRSLARLGDPHACQSLVQARELFETMRIRPRIEECDTLMLTVSERTV